MIKKKEKAKNEWKQLPEMIQEKQEAIMAGEQDIYVKYPVGILCENKKCFGSEDQHIPHRHTSVNCNDHNFCKVDHIPEHIDKYRDLPLMAYEFNEVKRIILNDEDIDGFMSVKYLRERNKGWFNGLDRDIPKGMKLIIDDR